MAREKIQDQIFDIDNTTAAAALEPTMKAVTQANGIELEGAFECQRNTLVIMVQNTTVDSSSVAQDTSVTLKAGEHYPNSILGDLTIAVKAGKTAYITVQDPSRFVTKDGSINIDFASGFTGNIAAIARPIGVAQ